MPRYERELTLDELAAIPDEKIDFSDIPELGPEFWAKARVVMPDDRKLAQITAKFDRDMLVWFRKQGRGYQARMNAVLRSYYEAHRMEPIDAKPSAPKRQSTKP